MNDSARWKWLLLLIVLILAGACLMVYPPAKTLKLGLDLRGGTTFIYEVDVPADANAQRVIEQTIEVLKDRADPQGLLNLTWRRLAGNRFEVQMPAASPRIDALRSEYLQTRKALIDTNIARGIVAKALQLPNTARHARFVQIAGSNSIVMDRLVALANAHDMSQPLTQANAAAQAEYTIAEHAVNELVDESDQTVRAKLQADVDAKLKLLIEKAGALNQATDQFSAAWDALLANNIDLITLENSFKLSNEPGPRDAEGNPGLSKRGIAADALENKYSGRSDAIAAVFAAYAEYEKEKGPLDDPEDFKRIMRGSGVLEFRIAPDLRAVTNADQYRTQLAEQGPRSSTSERYLWFEVDDITKFADTRAEQTQLLADPVGYFASTQGLIAGQFGDQIYLLLSNADDQCITQADEGWKLDTARPGLDDAGFRAVYFTLNSVGGQEMASLTRAHRSQPMAIVLDGKIKSAPTIQSIIATSGIITGGRGGFVLQEQQYLIRTLNAGSLEARVSDDPIYQKSFDARFGRDNLESGLHAVVWAMVVVAAFMALYYMVNGLIANFALFGNMALILAVMSTNFLGATFTLPGIAGIVLTIGMAVDANVLIFERIREELERGAVIKVAVRAGYQKALATIIDANITTLITCIVLGYTATAEIKGFAVTLGIGILATMFTALLCTRVWIEMYIQLTNAKTLVMVPTLVPAVRKILHPKVDWVNKRAAFFVLSTVLIVGSISLIYSRGEEMLDIEFRSGTQVGFNLSQGKSLELREVRERLDAVAKSHEIPQLEGDRAKVVITGEKQGTLASGFSIQTLATNENNRVSSAIVEAFKDVLDVKVAIGFDGSAASVIRHAPAYPIVNTSLGQNINRPEVFEDVSDYLGGVGLVIANMQPSATTEDVSERIERTLFQPPHNQYGYRNFKVIGLELDSNLEGVSESSGAVGGEDASGQGGQILYRSVVVVARDYTTNYVDEPNAFRDAGGLADTQWLLVRDAITGERSLGSVASFLPQVSNTMKLDAFLAIGLSLLAVVGYISVRFRSFRYGLAAIVALTHDVVIALGLVALAGLVADQGGASALLLSDFRIDLAIVAAILTIVGYSLNDTIVVFDRIRENRGRLAFGTPTVINDSVNQTLSRTVLTSFTTSMALLTIYFFGGDGVHGFAFTMLIGVLVGTYSSIAIAAPLVLVREGKQQAV